VPPVIDTVAFASVRLSGSVTDSDGDTATVWPGLNRTVVATLPKVGASLTLAMLTVVVCAVDKLPSLIVQVTLRVGFEP
jgi:hypothetical protein